MEPKEKTPTQRERHAAAPGGVGFGASPRRSSLGFASAMHGGAGGGGGGAPLPFGHDAPASGTVAFDEWKVKARALRNDADQLLAAFPRRKNGGKHDPKETEKSWVYRYLVIDEPLQLGRSGGLEIAGARGLAAADAGALFTATFGLAGAPDAEANVRLRLFVELAPKWIAFLAKALGTATAAEAAAADWAADCPLYLPLKTTTTMEKPADAETEEMATERGRRKEEMATEVERLRELPHERGGLLSFAPPRDEQPAALGFSLGTEVPTPASRPAEMVVLGRLLDGQKELAHLAESGRKMRLLRFHKTPHPASAGAG